MASPLYKFGDYDFENDAEQLSWEYDIDTPTYPLGREDGSRHGGATLTSKRITMEGFLSADSYGEWRSLKDALMRALFPTPRIQKLTLADDRSYMAEVSSFSVPEWVGLPQTPFSVTFFCHDPFEYAETQQNNIWSNAVSSAWTGYGSTYQTTFVINNPGLTAFPRIVFGWKAVTQPVTVECRWGNLLKNGGFITDAGNDGVSDYWTKSGSGTCNLDPSTSVFNKTSQEITNSAVQTTNVSQLVPTGPGMQGRDLTASCYIKRNGTNNNVYIRVEQYDSGGVLISGHNSTQYTSAIAFTRASTTFTVAANCYYVKFLLINEGACKANFDGAMLEIGSELSGSWQQGTLKSFTLTESLTASDVYVVDCGDKTITKNVTSSTITNKLSVMTGEFFGYEYGDNLLVFTNATSGVVGMYMQSTFTPRYL